MKLVDFISAIIELTDLENQIKQNIRPNGGKLVYQNEEHMYKIIIRPTQITLTSHEERERKNYWVEVEIDLSKLSRSSEYSRKYMLEALTIGKRIADAIDKKLCELFIGTSLADKLRRLGLEGIGVTLSLIPFIQVSTTLRRRPIQERASKEEIGTLGLNSWLFVKLLLSFR